MARHNSPYYPGYGSDMPWQEIERELNDLMRRGFFHGMQSGMEVRIPINCVRMELRAIIDTRYNYDEFRLKFYEYGYVVSLRINKQLAYAGDIGIAQQYATVSGGGNPTWEPEKPKLYTCKSCKEESKDEHKIDKRGECHKTREAFAIKVKKLYQHRKSKQSHERTTV